MEKHPVRIKETRNITQNVLKIEKPEGYRFDAGQATEPAINKSGWTNETRAFTFTCIPENDCLEFIVKTYPSHKGVTNGLLRLRAKDEVILHVVRDSRFGGEGLFIAGGAGVTPFISICRFLQSKNEGGNHILVFASKAKTDIVPEEEFICPGPSFHHVLSKENAEAYEHGHIRPDILRGNIPDNGKNIYLYGPGAMMEAMEGYLEEPGVGRNRIIKEAI